MSLAAVDLAASAFLLVAAAALLVAVLLIVSARRRPQPAMPAPIEFAARHPATSEPAPEESPGPPPLTALIACRNARLVSERDEARRRLADIRMAHRAQHARLERASVLINDAISRAPRAGGDGGSELARLRMTLSAAESHLLAARAAGRAGPVLASSVASGASDAGGGPATFPVRVERTMALSPDRNPPSRRPARSGPR